MKKVSCSSQPDAFAEVINQYNSLNCLLSGEATAKKEKYPAWLVIAGVKNLAGFFDSTESKMRYRVRTGKITGHRVNGTYLFLVSEVIQNINRDEGLSRLNFASYLDPGSEDEPKIHWVKFNRNDHILIKYTFKRETFATVLPVSYWTRDYRIGNHLLKEINKNLKSKNQSL